MCHDSDAVPGVFTDPVTSAELSRTTLTSGDGTRFAASLAVPGSYGPGPLGVLVLPDNRGLSRFYDELVRHLAGAGYPAVAVDYYGRSDGVGRDRPADFPVLEHLFKLEREKLFADFAAGAELLRAPAGGGCRAVVTLGFCMGGRFSWLCGQEEHGYAGVIGLYGWPGELAGSPGPTQLARAITAPLLALFGGGDEHITPEVVAEFDAALTDAGTSHEFHIYPGAPHAFFEAGLAEHAEASADAWRRILAFLNRTAPAAATRRTP